MINEQMPSQQVLVAGGAGFLGSHLCRRLLGDGHEVICLDNFSTGKRQNLAEFMGNPRFKMVRHDVIDPIRIDISPSQIYNFACAASPRHYQADPVHTLRTCVDGAFNLLELARRCKARILQASTSEVYGDPHVHPQPEAYRGSVNVVGVRSCYEEGKRCAETLFSDYGRRKNVEVKIARIFNTYGPYSTASDGRLISNFVTQSLSGKALTVYGDGFQTRSLCYIDDMIDGLIRLMNSVDTFRGPVNLGNPQENTVIDIARMVRRMVGADVSFDFKPLPSDDPMRRCPDILLAQRHLNWQPRVGLADGLRKTIDYFVRLKKQDQSGLRMFGTDQGGYKAFSG